ncbi:pectinesterase [Pseudomassariella vexata]|uniref:pectinesterase n=1 Tax=Pseudomassariella vexata TaxID=1141098 RepID=A0A1Y2E0E3_9PEZI|nr:pectinesterase [Pseudomassariella vexata]ORY64824.1 pectinesterase [Pseudomassariella vexata]
MVRLSAAVLTAVLHMTSAASGTKSTHPAKTYAECQRRTYKPLSGCPSGTLFVSQSSFAANFTSIQSAIASLPNDNSSHTILIAPGNYTEQLNVTRPGPLTLLGQSDDPYRGISYGASVSSDTDRRNGVQVLWAAANTDSTGQLMDNANTSVLTVAPTWNASLTGSGPTGFPVPADTPFGSSDFRAYNIDFRNVYSLQAAGPALAVNVAYANAGFYGCGFYSYQDTVYIGKLGNAYFYDNVVAGQTDFLYGFGTAWLERSTLALRNCGGGITAWKAGTNTTFINKYGVYISDSRIIAANASIAATIAGKCALGRPWNSLHRSIFMESYLDGSTLPAGYIKWGGTDPRYSNNLTLMAVYNDYGPGYNVSAMKASNVTVVLNDAGVVQYQSPADVLSNPDGSITNVSWIDATGLFY